MNEIASVRLDKTSFSVASLHAESDEKDYWLRQLNYGYDPATARLQRVLEVVERQAG